MKNHLLQHHQNLLSANNKTAISILSMIRDRDYGFKDNLGARTRSHYWNEGVLMSSRIDEPNKHHKFSLVDMVWIEIIDTVRGKKVNMNLIKDLIPVLFDYDNNTLNKIESMIITTSLNLGGLNDFVANFSPEINIPFDILTPQIKTNTVTRVNFTDIVRKVLKNTPKDFLTQYVLDLDVIRESKNIEPLLSGEDRKHIKYFDTKLTDAQINKVLSNPESLVDRTIERVAKDFANWLSYDDIGMKTIDTLWKEYKEQTS